MTTTFAKPALTTVQLLKVDYDTTDDALTCQLYDAEHRLVEIAYMFFTNEDTGRPNVNIAINEDEVGKVNPNFDAYLLAATLLGKLSIETDADDCIPFVDAAKRFEDREELFAA